MGMYFVKHGELPPEKKQFKTKDLFAFDVVSDQPSSQSNSDDDSVDKPKSGDSVE